jgi:hypothetical protein
MSDSLKATVIVIVPVLTISANGELEPLEPGDELELPRLPAVADPPAAPPAPAPDEVLDDELLLEEAEVVEPALTWSPGTRVASDTIVPLTGAYSFVSASACSALWTLASAP